MLPKTEKRLGKVGNYRLCELKILGKQAPATPDFGRGRDKIEFQWLKNLLIPATSCCTAGRYRLLVLDSHGSHLIPHFDQICIQQAIQQSIQPIYSLAWPMLLLSRSRNCWKNSMASGFWTVALNFTSLPLIIRLTAISTRFPLIVIGMSGTANTNLGTWRGDSPFRIAVSILLRRSCVRETPGFITRKRKTCSSVSICLLRPTQRQLLK